MPSISIDSLPIGHDKQAIIQECIQDNTLLLDFLYSANFKNTRVIRRFVELASAHIGMSEEWVNRIILIVDELNNNAIEHGSKKESENKMEVSIEKKGHSFDIHVRVEDSGTGPHPKKASDMEKLRKQTANKDFKKHDSIRGRGLFLIIARLVDDLYFKDVPQGGLIVGIHKKISL